MRGLNGRHRLAVVHFLGAQWVPQYNVTLGDTRERLSPENFQSRKTLNQTPVFPVFVMCFPDRETQIFDVYIGLTCQAQAERKSNRGECLHNVFLWLDFRF